MAEVDRWGDMLRGVAGEPSSQPRRIAELCVHSLAVSGAGISMVSDTGNRGVVCATDDVSGRIEELQVTLGEGPCVDAIGSGGPVLVSDLTDHQDLATQRWPTFLGAARDAGVRAVFAFPLRIGAIGIGALDLYRTTAGALTGAELTMALMAAEAAGMALLAQDLGDEAALLDDSQGSAYLAHVHQATGMVMVQLGVPVEQAFLLLRARAFAAGRPLRDLARDVVERRLRFSPEDL